MKLNHVRQINRGGGGADGGTGHNIIQQGDDVFHLAGFHQLFQAAEIAAERSAADDILRC